MKIVYFSPNDTTRQVTTAAAAAMEPGGEQIDLLKAPLTEEVSVGAEEMLVVGMPVYAGRIPGLCLSSLACLKGHGGPAAAIAVYGNRDYDDALLELTDLLEARGFRVVGAGAFIAKHSIFPTVAADRPDGSMRILSNLLKLAIPITLGSAATSLVTLIDTKLVMSQLTNIFENVDGLLLNADGTGPALDAARNLYGIYSKTMSIYNLPFSMMVPLTACIIPAVSASLARRDHLGAQKVSESALRIGLLLALPMGMGLFALGGPIMGLLFPAIDVEVAGPLLSVLGLASIFVALQLLCNSILQANGMVNLPILAVVIGGVVKVVVNFILVGNPDIRINGAPVGTLCCFIVISALEIFIIRRSIPAPPSFLRAFLKPFVPSAIMAAAAWAAYGLLTNFLRFGNALATIGGIGVGVVVYLVLVLALRVLSREDLELMPKGDKIARILHIK